MSINKWLWGGLGWALGGPIGGMLGYTLGSMTESKGNYRRTRGGDFGVSILILFAAIMKADGHLKKSELAFVKKFLIDNFGIRYAKERLTLFKKLLEQDINIEDVCAQIKTHMDTASKLQLIHILFALSQADNDVHHDEIKIINIISKSIGISNEEHKSISAMFVKDSSAAYQILNITKQSSDDEVKKAYRKMASKYHPDKVSHLGDDFAKIAEEKFKSVNDAYQQIKKERGLM